mmetsp:Transcript_111854/g.311305  ORF Transcript_111854/g.311305 Transcript_111854/m.311305 type:complete len:229 (-) Transcript_111854:134-820(-)
MSMQSDQVKAWLRKALLTARIPADGCESLLRLLGLRWRASPAAGTASGDSPSPAAVLLSASDCAEAEVGSGVPGLHGELPAPESERGFQPRSREAPLGCRSMGQRCVAAPLGPKSSRRAVAALAAGSAPGPGSSTHHSLEWGTGRAADSGAGLLGASAVLLDAQAPLPRSSKGSEEAPGVGRMLMCCTSPGAAAAPGPPRGCLLRLRHCGAARSVAADSARRLSGTWR